MVNKTALRVGFGVQDFTPRIPFDGAFKIYDPISFQALILEEAGVNVTFLAGDCFSIEQDLIEMVKLKLGDIDWLDKDLILPCAAHIGTTPILFQSYVSLPCEALKYYGREDYFADQMACAIRNAAKDMKLGKIGVGISSAPNILYNRRSYDQEGNLVMSNFKFPYPRPELTYGEVDDNVYVLRIDDTEGTPTHCAFTFGCHALCNTDKYGHITADYPGVVRKILRSAGVDSLFLPGSIGNVVPLSRGGRTFERVGHSVAGAALYALEQTETSEVSGLGVNRTTLALPTFPFADPKAVETELAGTPKRSDGLQRFQAYGSRLNQSGRTQLEYPITRISLTGADIIHLPGEIFVETAAAIRAAGDRSPTVVLSGPTADVGYLSTPEAHKEGGMEPKYAGLDINCELEIREAACQLVSG
ncbi:MAG: hypothetical protein CME25_00720 [Gemmatimonadetes bacterium]|nr:hypothetical protein [Gemmatimonadota bacterium]